MKILVKDIVNKNAISMQSGSNLYEIISPSLLSNKKIELDFEGVELYASPFFNTSIGLLLKDIEIETLKKNLTFTNISPFGRQLLNHVIANAINYYNEDSKVAEALKKINKNPEDRD